MERNKLTPQIVAKLAPSPEGEYTVCDMISPALSVRVRRTGARTYQVRYRIKGEGRRGDVRRYVIGSVDDISLADARREAERIRSLASLGKDPAGEKTAKRTEMTVAELCDHYLEEGISTKKASTIATDKGRIERHIKPLLGKKRLGNVTQATVEEFMRDVAKGKTSADIKTKARGRAIVEGGRGTASRTVGLLGGIFSFAVRRQLCPDNPVRGVQRYPDGKGERFLSLQELARLGETLRAFESRGTNKAALAIIRLLTVTGARKSEIVRLRWSEVDLERSFLRLEDSKTGGKIIPLGAPAIEVLAGVDRHGNSPWVFPAETGISHFQGTETVWKKVRNSAGLDDVRIHDLRHSFASVGLAGGNALPVIGAILGHADVKTTARYAHLADDPVKAAVTGISNSIAAAMAGNATAEVVPLERNSNVR